MLREAQTTSGISTPMAIGSDQEDASDDEDRTSPIQHEMADRVPFPRLCSASFGLDGEFERYTDDGHLTFAGKLVVFCSPLRPQNRPSILFPQMPRSYDEYRHFRRASAALRSQGNFEAVKYSSTDVADEDVRAYHATPRHPAYHSRPTERMDSRQPVFTRRPCLNPIKVKIPSHSPNESRIVSLDRAPSNVRTSMMRTKSIRSKCTTTDRWNHRCVFYRHNIGTCHEFQRSLMHLEYLELPLTCVGIMLWWRNATDARISLTFGIS